MNRSAAIGAGWRANRWQRTDSSRRHDSLLRTGSGSSRPRAASGWRRAGCWFSIRSCPGERLACSERLSTRQPAAIRKRKQSAASGQRSMDCCLPDAASEDYYLKIIAHCTRGWHPRCFPAARASTLKTETLQEKISVYYIIYACAWYCNVRTHTKPQSHDIEKK